MSGTLLHVLLAQRAIANAGISPELKRDITQFMDDYRLGSVLVDLPYFEKLWLSGLRSLAGLDMHYNVWGTLLHRRSPSHLAKAFFDKAKDGASRSLSLGLLTHLAVDLVFHEEIDQRVMAHADGTVSLDTEHKRVEDQMDLHVFCHLLGHSGIGTPYAREKLALAPGANWTSQFSEAVTEIHGISPSKKVLEQWLRGLRLYGYACSSKRAPWVTALPDHNPELQKTSIQLANRALSLASQYIEAGAKYSTGTIDGAAFTRTVSNRSLISGGKPDPVRPKGPVL
jgi:hypothetical protein